MSTAIAMVPSPAPHERAPAPEISTTTAAPAASQAPPSATSPTQKTNATATSPSAAAQRTGSISPRSSANKNGNTSPTASRSDPSNPKVIIKKEPKSPGDAAAPASRPRPSKLDLSKNKGISTAGGPATALGIQEVGIACLSPGFSTQNPVMKEKLERSMTVRDQQLKIIESRIHQQPSKPDNASSSQTFPATPGLSNRKKNRPGPIVAPNHGQFRGDRGIQSAPLGHSFQPHQHPSYPARHQPSAYGPPHPSQHPANKLPPISDVFNHGPPQHPEPYRAQQRPLQSPSHPPPPPPPPHHHHQQHPGYPQRGERDYKSAEEAQQELAAGRPELLPKIVHYGGHQPPTPPSPIGANRAGHKRVREDYEHGSSPPLGTGPAPRRGPFGAGIDSPRTQQAKREEFLRLCERAWDLFHS